MLSEISIKDADILSNAKDYYYNCDFVPLDNLCKKISTTELTDDEILQYNVYNAHLSMLKGDYDNSYKLVKKILFESEKRN